MSFPYSILYTVLCVQGQIFEEWGVKEKKRGDKRGFVRPRGERLSCPKSSSKSTERLKMSSFFTMESY